MSTSVPSVQRHRPLSVRRAWLPAAVVLAAAVAAVLVGRSLLADDSPAPRPELQRVLDRLVTGPERIAPGATAYVAGPRGTWLGSAGVANVATGEPMPADARIRLESVGKIWTAALILQLAQAGELRVGDTVERWLPGLLPDGGEITVRHLLTMTSGLIDDNDLVGSPTAFRTYLDNVGDPELRAELTAIVQRLEGHPAAELDPMWVIRFVAWQPLLFTPGTDHHYSNTGYLLLGLIAERAGGAPLAELYRERIFEPLGLEDTAYDPQGPIAGPHARGYSLTAGGRLTDASDRHVGKGADGGIVSTAEETATFLTALMGGELLDAERVAGMRGADLWEGGDPSGCAGPAYGWSGGGDGYKTNVWVSGDGSRVAVLLLNARDRAGSGDEVAGGAMIRLYCSA